MLLVAGKENFDLKFANFQIQCMQREGRGKTRHARKNKNNFFMLSKEFLIERGYCCGNGCFMCPYKPRHTKDSTRIMSELEWKELRSKNL